MLQEQVQHTRGLPNLMLSAAQHSGRFISASSCCLGSLDSLYADSVPLNCLIDLTECPSPLTACKT